MEPIPVMTIGGSDPSGGAGIQTDIKAFQSIGLHPVSVLTSSTVQNTQTVKHIFPLPPDLITAQIETIMEDIPVQFVKTGLLYQSDIAKRVAQATKRYNWHLIVDPVLIATSGDTLSSSDLVMTLKKTIIPLSEIITPNISEAETLATMNIKTVEDMGQAAKLLHGLGTKNVIVKGGHLLGNTACDLLYDGTTLIKQELPKTPSKKAHGSGCTFSALITGFLAKGYTVQESFFQAKPILWQMINSGYIIGKGADVLAVSQSTVEDAPFDLLTQDHTDTWMTLYAALSSLLTTLPTSYIPEVGCNIGYAIPHAKAHTDICALDGRIVRRTAKPYRCGPLRFGASKHIASIILATLRYYPSIRCALNIRYSPQILSLCTKTGYTVTSFDRAEEPPQVSSMDWGTTTALQDTTVCPDIIFDTGGIGKEPMIRLLGKTPIEVIEKLKNIKEEI